LLTDLQSPQASLGYLQEHVVRDRILIPDVLSLEHTGRQ
jgi:hypothetical protein